VRTAGERASTIFLCTPGVISSPCSPSTSTITTGPPSSPRRRGGDGWRLRRHFPPRR
jgi:hypothetical protein